ncbi:MAG TPA: NACHT domain-containing protein [Lentzea sp.]
MGLEIVAVSKLGQSVALRAATEWLATPDTRTLSLTDLAAQELSKPTQRAKLDTLVQHIGHQVTEQLEAVLERFTADEITTAVAAVEAALSSIDLSDSALLADDADPEVLAQRIRRSLPRADSGRCYDIALDQSCRYLIQILRHLPSFQPRTLAEVLSRATAQTALLEDVLSRLPRTSLYAPQGTDNDDEFRDEYLRYIARTFDRLELLGLSMKDRPRLALSAAYLSLTISGEERHRHKWFDETDRHTHSAVRVESALVSRTFVRGEAGSGKTTLLDWLAITAARGGFTGDLRTWNGLIPFPIRLRAYADSPLPARPEEFVTGLLRGLMPAGWVHRVLKAGKGLLLVDGVDEVQPAKRQGVREWLRELMSAFPEAQVVVTARPAATDGKWLAELDFSSVVLEQMSPADVKAFLQRWHEAAGATEETQRRLVTQLDSREHLRTLASSPLLCAMLCALNLGRVSELPQNRMELYAAALTMLLDLRDAERGIARMLTTSDKTVLLRDLAWRLTLGNRSQLPTAKVRDHVTRKIRSMPNVDQQPDAVVTHLLERSGVIREPVPGQVDFVHRTFQEYLAGEEAMQDGQIETLVSHAHLDSWLQTIVLACGHGQRTQVNDLLTEVLDRAEHEPRHARRLRLLAGACLETVRDLDPDVHHRVDEVIKNHLVPPRSTRETASLATIGHRILRYLPQSLEGLSASTACATVSTAGQVGSPEAMELLSCYAGDPRWKVQRELIAAWEHFDPKRYAVEVLQDAPLLEGAVFTGAARLLPHLTTLRHCTSAEVSLPAHERQRDLTFAARVNGLSYLQTYLTGRTDLSPLTTCRALKTLYLFGAQNYVECEELPDNVRILGLHQLDPWHDLGFLRGREVTTLDLSEVASDCDLSAVADMPGLQEFCCRSWQSFDALARLPYMETLSIVNMRAPIDLSELPELPDVGTLLLRSFETIDLRAIADKSLRLDLNRTQRHIGLDELGPDVTINWVG